MRHNLELKTDSHRMLYTYYLYWFVTIFSNIDQQKKVTNIFFYVADILDYSLNSKITSTAKKAVATQGINQAPFRV